MVGRLGAGDRQWKMQDAMGDLTGRPEDNVRGKLKKVEGKMQEGVGRMKSAARKMTQ